MGAEMKRFKLLAVLIGVAVGSSIAANGQQAFASAGGVAANGQSLLTGEVSRSEVTLRGNVSLMELAGSEANRLALGSLQDVMPIEQPQHRLPNGGLTSQPSGAMRQALPGAPQTNAQVAGQLAPSSTNASISGFTGVYEGNNVTANGYELEPPDQGLAVYNNVAVEIVNNVLRVFKATNGAPLTPPIATTTLFNLDPNVYNVSDPQVFFDPISQRWFLTEVVYNATANAFAIAVSQTSDPLGSYWVYLVDAYSSQLAACGLQDCFPDYPKDGYNADAFFITADLFSNVSGNYVEAAIYAFPKDKLEAGASFDYLRFDDPNDFVLQPSVPAPGEPFSTARNGSEFLMSAPTASFGSGPPRVSVLAVINTKSIVHNPGAVQVLVTSVRTKNYGNGTVPSTEPNVVGKYCASVGVTSAPLLDAGYSTFQSTIQKANGNLYGALAQGTVDGAGLQRDIIDWFEVHPVLTGSGLSASVVNQGRIVPPGGYSIAYPAFGLLQSGAGFMGFTITNVHASVAGGFPSAAVIQFDGSTPTGGIIVTGPGSTSDDGFTGCGGPGPGTVGRWGDYGAAVVDAATGYIYTANEMIPDPKVYKRGKYANWGTFVTRLR
jgi:hypothetical protein